MVDCIGLENRHTETYQGFESLSLRGLFGMKALPSERGKVKPVDCPTVDERLCVLKSNGRKKQEKRGGLGISEAHAFRRE